MKKGLILLSKIIVIFVFVIFAVTIANNLIENYKNTPTQDYSVKQDAAEQTPVERSAAAKAEADKRLADSLGLTPTPAPTPEPVSINLSAGKYIAGQDIPIGKYDVTWVSGTGNFFADNPTGIGINEAFGENDNFIKIYKNATFKSGNEIEVRGNLIVNLTSK